MANKEDFLIIDGHHLLFRMFYGVQSKLRSKDGILINAVLGFIGTILKYIKHFKPKYIIVIFDSNKPSFRKKIDEYYKGNRQSDYSAFNDDENPFIQLPIIKELLNKLNIKYCEIDGFEADDIIAAYSRKYHCTSKCIISGDTDLLQLIDDTTILYMDRGKKTIIYDEKNVIDKFNVNPIQIVDYKALVGDKSDNISGIFGVGPKTAAKLINNYHCVENIISSINEIKPEGLQKKIENNTELVLRNKKLIMLNSKAPLIFEIKELEIDHTIYNNLTGINVLKENLYL